MAVRLGRASKSLLTLVTVTSMVIVGVFYFIDFQEDQSQKEIHSEEEEQCIMLWTPKHSYKMGRTIAFHLTNVCNRTLDGTPGFKIYNSTDVCVYDAVVPQVILHLEPGQSIHFYWRQHDDSYDQVPPGMYYAWARFSGYEDTTEYFAIVGIESDGGIR